MNAAQVFGRCRKLLIKLCFKLGLIVECLKPRRKPNCDLGYRELTKHGTHDISKITLGKLLTIDANARHCVLLAKLTLKYSGFI